MIPMYSGLDLDRIAADALREVLGTRFKRPPFPVSPDEIPGAPGDALWLTSSVSLEGTKTQGNVHLQISESLLDPLNDSLGDCSRDPSARESELADLAGELCNMVAGRISAGLAAAGHLLVLSTPIVLRGRQREAATGPATIRSHTNWTCAGGALILTVRIK
jgi:hypothetical protein